MEQGAGLAETASQYFGYLSEQVTRTVEVMEGLIKALGEINFGTKDIQSSTALLVQLSKKNSTQVEQVENISKSTEAVVEALQDASHQPWIR